MSFGLALFEDERAGRWLPFSLTRPVGELLYGSMLLRERTERALGVECTRYVTSGPLRTFAEPGAPPARPPVQGESAAPRVFVNSRVVLEPLTSPLPVDATRSLLVAGRVAGVVVPAGTPSPDDLAEAFGPDAPSESAIELKGSWLESPWEAMASNGSRLEADLAASMEVPALPTGVHHIGDGPLSIDPAAEIEPGCVLDTSTGPIRLEAAVRVRAFTRLAGPAWVGPGSHILGGSVGNVSIGPVCRIHGEVSSSVVLGFSNKAHDGFLGHAYLGRWVNLGAFTTNSNLKNNYGSVRLNLAGRTVDTGRMKVGCFLGDHVRTGIGTLLNTGTVVGPCSNLFGGRMPPSWVPPFSWGTGESLGEYRLDKFLDTAATAMGRRDQELTADLAEVYRAVFEASRHERSLAT